MKHYFSFLVLSLSVFLSLVCPSPVMAELVSSLKVEAEDGLNIEVLNSNNCSPSNMSLNTESKFGAYSGTGGMISPENGGEVYLPLVIDYNGTPYGSMSLDFHIRCGNNMDDRTYINFYQECAENDSPDLQISSPGSYYNKYYRKVAYQKVYSGVHYEAYQTHIVNRSFTEGSYLIGLYARGWAIYDYVQINTSAAIIQKGDEEPSCIAPNHVDISGRWDWFGGETISLTAAAYASAGTGSPIADGAITGWQWEKLVGSTWTPLSDGTDAGVTISGATTKNLQIANCVAGNSGKYRCVVSTGATCSTSSATKTDGTEGFGVKVYVLECYTGGTTVYNFTRTGDTQAGTCQITLAAGNHAFKFHADNDYYGNNGTINEDVSNWVCSTSQGNLTIAAGLGGTFTINMEYSTSGSSNVLGEPEISVTYPRKTIYLTPGVWNSGGAKFAFYYFRDGGSYGWTDFITANDCGSSADIPQWNGVKVNAVRLNSSCSSPNWSDKWNQTSNITVTSNNSISIIDWGPKDGDSPYDYGTYSTPTYTISYAAGTGGSISNVTEIPCGEEHTLVANEFTKTGHSFTGWIANVDVKINGETVTAGTLIADGATIQNITQNITLTAQWTPAAGKTVPCSLGFYYTKTGGKDDKDILDSDFSYSCNKDIAKNDQHKPNPEVCFSGAGHTLTSRETVTFPSTGTYTFTFPLYIKESGNYDAPRVTVNGQQSDLATISTKGAESRNYETTLNVTAGTYTVSVWIGNTNEKVFFSTMNITSDQSGNIITSLPWGGSQNLTEGTVVSTEAFNSCFDSEITFTFTGEGTVNYYDNNDRNTSLGTVTSGQPIELNNDLRAHGIYIRCTEGTATLTGVSKTTKGSVYQIWSGEVAVGDWKQQVVLGPEHFQTAIVGDVLRVITSGEDVGGDAQGALQYIYTAQDGTHTYKGLDNSDGEGLRDWTLSGDDKDRHYFEIEINETHLANLKQYGVIVKGRYYTIQSVELRASCANQTMRTTAPDKQIYGEDGNQDIMTKKLEFPNGFDLGIWEHKLELDEKCFENVTVGSLINFYMQVQEGATLSFRCNVDSIHAQTYDPKIPRCPSYGDISFDRTIDDLYGDEPKLIGNNNGYRVLYLLVDADMLSRLKETGMIICGKGTFIKAVEGVPNPFVINPGDNKEVPTVVNNLEIHQGGEAKNNDDIEVLGSITYFRPAKGGHLNNQLDIWYTFTLPFEVNKVEVYDETDKAWFDINAVYYSDDKKDQNTNAPDGKGHYYLQYLSKQEIATDREAFITRWQYITPGHSEYIYADTYKEKRYGYPKKNEAYIILFDNIKHLVPSDYWISNPKIRFVGGPQTIEGFAKRWEVTSDGYEYWMYANNTLHSFTLDEAYILNKEGTYFILQSNPTIRPFECYVQATTELKTKTTKISMRGFNIEDNTPTGAESIQGSAIRAEKILRNGQLIIIRNGVEYDATGAVIR